MVLYISYLQTKASIFASILLARTRTKVSEN